jgi:hypothetical protein
MLIRRGAVMRLNVEFSESDQNFNVEFSESDQNFNVEFGDVVQIPAIPKDYGKITYNQNRSIIVS